MNTNSKVVITITQNSYDDLPLVSVSGRRKEGFN